ncbi:ATP-binding protein [Reichenbachiella agarivorans]|uniref:histidine kinase n=1 Tax=Reichenbachiella agarivorans TaxID=2979464 RepID=A0ABY6CQR4_9BACT|nr:ATP-binding protein [Reichenbachiella agarivorans]UXP32855.1 ATP-binding protein [Reichenbachiella agarivorans]
MLIDIWSDKITGKLSMLNNPKTNTVHKKEGFNLSYSSLLIGCIISLGLLILFETMMYYRHAEMDKNQDLEAVSFGSELIPRIDRELNKLIYLSSGLEAYLKVYHNEIESDKIEQVMEEITYESKFIKSIGLSIGTVIQYVAPYEGNQKAIGLDYRLNAEQWPDVKQLIETRQAILSGPVNLVQGGRSFIYRTPIFVQDKLFGILSTVVDIDPFFETALMELTDRGYKVSIRQTWQDSVLLYGKSELFASEHAVKLNSEILNQKWEYAIASTRIDSRVSLMGYLHLFGRCCWLIVSMIIIYALQITKTNITSKRKYDILAKNISDFIWIHNSTKGYFTYMSPSQNFYSGYSSEELRDKKLGETLTRDSQVILHNRIEEARKEIEKTGQSDGFFLELEQNHKDGHTIWIEISAKVRKNSQAEIEILGISRNVDDRKRAQIELHDSEKQLIELNATKDRFFSIIAHDLKSPFISLTSMLDLMLGSFDQISHEEKIKYLSMCRDSTVNTAKLLENLLTWARSQSGDLNFKPVQVKLSDSISKTLGIFEITASNKEQKIVFEKTDQYSVFADKFMLETILRNLISNALKFTPRGGRITIDCTAKEDYVTVSIIDTGVGMSSEAMDNLFVITKKTSTPGTENEKGTGLGLLLCKELVEKNGGNLSVQSTQGQGSMFSFTVPLAVDWEG